MEPRKFIILSDIHGNMMDERACSAALAFAKDFKPDIKVIAGDLWDFSAIRKGASDEESRIYGNVVFGHIHSIESFQTPGLEQREARSIGCLCSLNPDYANRKTGKLRWAHGWGFGWIFPDGTYQINQARNVEGNFYAPTEIKKY